MGDPVWMALALTAAIAADLALGDPRSRWHPVAWMGTFLARGQRRLCRGSPSALVARGALLVAAAGVVAAVAGALIAAGSGRIGWPGVIIEGIALKLSFSLRDLASACLGVGRALERAELGEARRLVGLHLVSRPTADLGPGHVASAAIESAAENLTDAFIAPLVFYVAFGLAGAYVYRIVNTADAMLGYRVGDLEYFGKIAARTDDILNFLPARIAGLLIAACAALGGANARAAWRTMLAEHRRTASPNAGWTMAAMAGALGVALEKPGSYRLGEGRVPGAGDVVRSVRLTVLSALVGAAAMVGGLLAPS